MKKRLNLTLDDSNAQKSKASFPRETLVKALSLAQAIKDKNGGNPWPSDQAADAVGTTRKSNNFVYLCAAARDYGLTKGGRNTDTVELQSLGREIVYADTPEIEAAKKRDAFLSVELFKKVLDFYKGANLPEMKYLGNTLESTFGLSREKHEDFSRIFRENCEHLGITSGFNTSKNGDGNGSASNDQPNSNTPPTVTLAEPSGSSGGTAFVIIPFVERDSVHPKGFFTEVLRNLITPAALAAGFTVKTANRQGSDVIQSTIINDLINADLVIADLTEHNPNVLFELGIRIAQKKPVALIKASATGRIFDVDNMIRVFEYQATLWKSTIEADLPGLTDHIRGTWEKREATTPYMDILLKQSEVAQTH